MTRRGLLFVLGVLAVIGGVFWLNVRVGGPSPAVAQQTQQGLNSANPILSVVAVYPDGGAGSLTYVPMQATVGGAPVVALANPGSSIPSNGIALATDAGTNLVVSALQGFLVNLDAGTPNLATLFLPQLSSTTVVVCSLANPANGQYGCSTVTEAPGGDAGVVLVQCGGAATLAADGGQANCIRLN